MVALGRRSRLYTRQILRCSPRFSPVQAGNCSCCIEHMFAMAKCKFNWPQILAYREAGHTLVECQRRFGFHPDAWYKAIRRGTIAPGSAPRHVWQLKYDWGAVARYYDDSHSYRECRERFGFAYDSWRRAVRRGDIRPREKRWPLEQIMAKSKSRRTIKKRLLEAGILENRCDECGLSEWRGRPLSVQIDHRNGVNDDHRVENLRMLCPNCHSQTETYGGKNRKRKRTQISFLILEERSRVVQLEERGPLKSDVGGSNPSPGARAPSSSWPRTPGSQLGNTGSNPVGAILQTA